MKDDLVNYNLNKEALHIRVKQLIRMLINDTQPEYLASERELQRQLGVSRTTVRKALNELVQEKRIVAEHGRGYRVIYAGKGRSLSGKIGFAMINSDDVFVNSVFRTMIDEVFSKKFEPVVTNIDLRYESPAEKISKLLAFTDGIIINSNIIRDGKDDFLPEGELYRCVALPYPGRKIPLCSIMADMHSGAIMLTRHLLRQGHRKIAVLSGDTDRVGGFREAMAENGISINEDIVCMCNGYRHSGFEQMGMLLERSQDFTAVVCQNDAAALGAMEQCFLKGIKVPDEISIVGFDNIKDSERFPVPLTTAGIDLKIMCRKALNLLLEGLRTGEKQQAIKLKPELINRKSVMKLN